jgi:hypothetical protein
MAGKFESAQQRDLPDRIVMEVPGLPAEDASDLAVLAVAFAYQNAPKSSGRSARRLTAVYGVGFFGIHWLDDYVWYQEQGTRAHTMRSLAGKTIPMWVDDPDGKVRRENPKAEVRDAGGGRMQVRIFRRAAKMGQRKQVRRLQRGVMQTVDVPASYPGAPGRIALRRAGGVDTVPGTRGGQIHPGNVGVRWRHPGLAPRGFIDHALRLAAREGGVAVGPIYPVKVG